LYFRLIPFTLSPCLYTPQSFFPPTSHLHPTPTNPGKGALSGLGLDAGARSQESMEAAKRAAAELWAKRAKAKSIESARGAGAAAAAAATAAGASEAGAAAAASKPLGSFQRRRSLAASQSPRHAQVCHWRLLRGEGCPRAGKENTGPLQVIAAWLAARGPLNMTEGWGQGHRQCSWH
jgi:hypothetical protein